MNQLKSLFYFLIKDLKILPSNQKEWLDYLEKNDNKKFVGEFYPEKGVRTLPQNNSLHLWCDQVAKELNEKGLTVQEVLKRTVEIDWNGSRVKEIMWRPVQIALTKKESTTKLTKTGEIDEIYDHLNRFLAEKCDGIHVEFPKKKEDKALPDYPKEELKPNFDV